ncbi:protein kinase domain-containing protein [Cordyceps fumosorosea ARSEF 2679]|uniref:non-specific serine/threonine protein kinase n=1 Tax=Cordyceps fumosorosea (strain ARSEF 2679) TaxID=1081104 RepID=A0A168EME8_CORFA|nr:protein kinase domain-containing protein [Cordyceps fumosorosea ARSEF 2679]OAA73986.1 protein kinase domain-containing protein [Cordyceps fumosorosea ARSEF 2679]
MFAGSTRKRLASKLGFATQTPPSRPGPSTFPSQGFTVIPGDHPLEEESMPEYQADHFYPMVLGQLLHDCYQTVAKLGYGSSSTVWLARDLEKNQYVASKVYMHNSVKHREPPFYQHLEKALPSRHTGASNIRKLLAAFEVAGPKGKHIVLAMQVSQMSLRDMDAYEGTRLS